MPRIKKTLLRRRLSPVEATILERKLMYRQRRGEVGQCIRTNAKDRKAGIDFKCVLKHYILAPTFRYCPDCAVYRRSLSHYASMRKKQATKAIVAEFEESTVEVLTRDRKALLDKNQQLAKDVLEMSSTIKKLRKDKAETAAAMQRWHTAMQREFTKTSRLDAELKETQGQVSQLTSQLTDAQYAQQNYEAQHQAYEAQSAQQHFYNNGQYFDQNYFQPPSALYHQAAPVVNAAFQQHF